MKLAEFVLHAPLEASKQYYRDDELSKQHLQRLEECRQLEGFQEDPEWECQHRHDAGAMLCRSCHLLERDRHITLGIYSPK